MNSNRGIFLFIVAFFILFQWKSTTRNALDMINFIKRSMRMNKVTVACSGWGSEALRGSGDGKWLKSFRRGFHCSRLTIRLFRWTFKAFHSDSHEIVDKCKNTQFTESIESRALIYIFFRFNTDEFHPAASDELSSIKNYCVKSRSRLATDQSHLRASQAPCFWLSRSLNFSSHKNSEIWFCQSDNNNIKFTSSSLHLISFLPRSVIFNADYYLGLNCGEKKTFLLIFSFLTSVIERWWRSFLLLLLHTLNFNCFQ